MATNTSQLKTFAQNTRAKLVSLITTKLHYLLSADNAELRGWENEIKKLRQTIASKGEKNVIEEVAYTWFNRVMALRYMDARGYNSPMVVSVAEGQTRPQILEEAMSGNIDGSLNLKDEEKLLEGAPLYRRLLIAVCNQFNASMPFLFEHLMDYTELLLPDDLLSEQSFVTDIRKGMSDEDCQNVEIMGWLYQFYITDRKAEAEKNKSRRGGLKSDEQAAATQLFTPHWIVRYMVENSLGRIWMTLHPESELIKEMPYYIAPIEGQIDVIPDDIKSVKDIRFLDPCMGSGHILVYAFDLFAKMYEEEGYESKKIPSLILQNNLFGIDIDPRCYQLASFALTMKACEYYRRYLRNTVKPNVIALEPIDRQTIESTGNWPKDSLIWQMEYLDTIGSLLTITPEEATAIRVGEGIFAGEQRLMKEQAEYLSQSYHCVVTNPPYLGKGIGEVLKKYLTKYYPDSKADTMATFMERCAEFAIDMGKWAMVNMQSWMFLSSYEGLRRKLLDSFHVDSLLHLGPHAFDELPGEKVQTASYVFTNISPSTPSVYVRLVEGKNCEVKHYSFLHSPETFLIHNQGRFESIPGSPMAYWVKERILDVFAKTGKITDISKACAGVQTGDTTRFIRLWFEVPYYSIELSSYDENESIKSNKKWFRYNKGGEYRKWYGVTGYTVNWENDAYEIKNCSGSVLRNPTTYFKECISWSNIMGKGISMKFIPKGFIYDIGAFVAFPKNNELYFLLGLCNSKILKEIKPAINPTFHFTPGDYSCLPVPLLEDYTIFDNTVMENINISTLDWDAHETSWDFQTNELVRIAKENSVNLLHTILVYYKREWEEKFFKLHENEEELNRKFIEIYGLQDELTPEVPLNEVTILQKGEISIEDDELVWHDDAIIKQFISYLVGCFMGRYSIEYPGLIIANQGQKPEDLDFESTTIEIDDDGIIPIVLEPDFFADDMTYRVEKAVEALFGKENKEKNIRFIENALGDKLRKYFFKKYYADHTEMYSVKGAKRPIYWLFSSKMGDKKKKGYFKALVYMHRMESDTLSKLHADYAVPYLSKLERQFRELEDELSRDDLPNRKKILTQAEELRGKIREVKEFADELAKMASHRPTIDLDDGVAVNYPKFYPLLELIKFPKPSED